MVRAIAASAGLLRELQVAFRAQPQTGAEQDSNRSLDRAVIALVLIFLGVVATSIAVQSTTSWSEQLLAAENRLALAAELVASRLPQGNKVDIGNTESGSTESKAVDLPLLPRAAVEPGRRFFVLDPQGVIRGGHAGADDINRSASRLFADAQAFEQAFRSGKLTRIALHNGDVASTLVVRAAGFEGSLLVVQRVNDELRLWWRHASAIGAILLCFGAVTIAFTAVFGLQRQRAFKAGAQANRMSTLAELALEHGHCGVWDWTLGSDSVHWSDSMHHLLGRAPDGDKDTTRITQRLHPDDAGLLDEIRAAIISGQRDFDRLFRMQDEDRNWLWLRMRAVVVRGPRIAAPRLFGIVMDVTQERAAAEADSRADARLRDAIESLSEAFVLWDDNNRLVMCNSKYQSFHALPAHLVENGVDYTTLMAAAREPRVLIEIDRGSHPDNGARTYEAQFQDASWLLISERPTKDGGYVSVGTDITSRKLQEARLVENERKLQLTVTDLGNSREAFRRQAAQLAELADRYLEQKAEAVSANRAKAEFLANMNHEIRTPLNHIIGFSEMIEGEVFGPCGSPRYLEYARHIGASGSSLLALISDILDMARIEAGRVMLDRTPTAIGTLLEQAVGQVREAAEEKRVTIEIDPDASEPAGQRRIEVDPAAIAQAMAHLLRNSIRLTPIGGKVAVRARMSGEHVNIFVADWGCSLSAGDLGKMVDPFGHIDGMLQDGCKGSGLGVSISRSLIELHGGTMRLRSSPQMGSLIMIRLPIVPSEVQLNLPMTG